MNNPKKIYQRDGWECLKCGSTEGLTVDHIVPKVLGGHASRTNLQTLCFKCNREKGTNIVSYRKDAGAEKTFRRYSTEIAMWIVWRIMNERANQLNLGDKYDRYKLSQIG